MSDSIIARPAGTGPAQARPFGLRDKIGYMFGDFGNDFMFIFASSFLMIFYTKIMGVPGTVVGTLFLVARIVDAFADVTVGVVVDRARTHPQGKYRVLVLRFAAPVAVSSFLMYQTFTVGSPMGVRIAYMYVTYMLWGVLYSCINIPYGSMASVISPEAEHRSALSTFRSVGSTFGSLVVSVLVPLIIYETDGQGNQIIRGGEGSEVFAIVSGVFAVCSVICFLLCYRMTSERVRADHQDHAGGPGSVVRMIGFALSSRAMVALLIGALALLMAMLFLQQMTNYLFADYFRSAALLSGVSLASSLVMLLVCAPLSIPLSRRFGRKAVVCAGALVGAVSMFALFVLRTHDVWVFATLDIVSFLGIGMFNMVVFAMVTDVIDDIEVTRGVREDATCYSVYSFARKLGQAFAGWFSGAALGWIGYQSGATAVQSRATLDGLYTYTTLLPAIFFALLFVAMFALYPLSKRRVDANVATLKARRAEG